MNRLIGSVLGVDKGIKNNFKYRKASKYTRKLLNMLYRAITKSVL